MHGFQSESGMQLAEESPVLLVNVAHPGARLQGPHTFSQELGG